MLTTDPVIQAGVLATRECMIPGRARIKHSVQCFLRELMREWPTDESEDLLFSITAASKRVGLDRSVLYVGRRNLVADDAIRFHQREDGSIVYYVDWAKIVNAYGMKRRSGSRRVSLVRVCGVPQGALHPGAGPETAQALIQEGRMSDV